jgi:hypothetical protein
MRYNISATNVATSAVADTVKTMLMVRAADTLGHRCKLLALIVGPADAAPADANFGIGIKRVNDVSAGGAGTFTAVTPSPADDLSRAAVVTGGHTATVEPTTYETTWLWGPVGLNSRNSLSQWLGDLDLVVNRDALAGVIMWPEAAAAGNWNITMVVEEF